MITGARQYINIPAPPVAPGGIMRTARVIPTDGHALLGAEYETDACAEARLWDEFCTLPGVDCGASSTGSKTFDGAPELVVGDPFAVYAGVECELTRLEEAQRRAERRLAYAEGAQIDARVVEILDGLATDASAAVPAQPGHVVSFLEAFAARLYGGPLTVVISRSLIGCLCDCLHIELDGSLTTKLGSRVAPVIPEDPATDPSMIYVTGQITLLQGPLKSYVAPPMQCADGTWIPTRALAERIYVPLIECVVAKADATCP